MDVKIWTNKVIYIIQIKGSIGLADAEKLKQLVMKMIEKKAERFIIDAAKISSIESNGIGAFIYISSTAKNLGLSLEIVNVSGQVKQVIEKIKLTDYFPIGTNVEEAIRKLS